MSFSFKACLLALVLTMGGQIALAADLDSVIAAGFVAKGQAGLDRLEQSPMQKLCSGPVGMDIALSDAARIQKAATDAVQFPADGQYLGDWKSGEKIAQRGKGMQYSDDPEQANGGNCYACHELSVDEIAFGNMGPSLKHYGKIRGDSEAMLKYTWTRIWNSHAFNACTHMPAFGARGILSEQQIKDVMALLFDPDSPVNAEAESPIAQ